MVLSRDEVLSKLTDYLEELFEVPRNKITLEASLRSEERRVGKECRP